MTETTKEPDQVKEDLNQAENPEEVSQEVKEFNQAFHDFNDTLEYTIKLYRVTGPRRTKKYLSKYENEIPDEEEIGSKYGGGKFAIMAVHPVTNKLHCKYIDIDESFNSRAEIMQGRSPAGMDLNSQVGPLDQLEKLSEIMKNLSGGQAAQPLKMMESMMEGVSNMFTNGLKKIQGAAIDQTLSTMKQDPPESEGSDLTEIIKLISQFGEKFIEARGAQSELMKQVITADPQFQAAQEDQDLIVELYDQCVSDPSIGKEKIDKIMEKLGIEVPPDIPAAPNIGSIMEKEITNQVQEG